MSDTKEHNLRKKNKSSKERILVAAERLFREFGYSGTALSAIAKEGKAPMGSVYFHFPDGKEQIAVEALKQGSERVSSSINSLLQTHSDPGDAIAQCAIHWANALEESKWAEGCPIAATALQMSSSSEAIRKVGTESFDNWKTLFSDRLNKSGLNEDESSEMAEVILSLLEGAELMSKVEHSRRPLENAAKTIKLIVGSMVAGESSFRAPITN